MRMADHPLYMTWKSMKTRCYNRNASGYKYYGGKGVTVCDQWIHDFWRFTEDMGQRPEGTTLDRIDNTGNYCPENCRWATNKQQSTNRSDSLALEVLGEILTESQVAEKYGIKRTTVQQRRNSGSIGYELITGKKPHGMLEFEGKLYKQVVFAEILGISPQLLNKRLKEKNYKAEDLVNEFGPIQGAYEGRAVPDIWGDKGQEGGP